jgi:hypothetical protein
MALYGNNLFSFAHPKIFEIKVTTGMRPIFYVTYFSLLRAGIPLGYGLDDWGS